MAKKRDGFALISGIAEKPEAITEAIDKYEAGLARALGGDPRKVAERDISLSVRKLRADRASWVEKQAGKGKDE